VCNDTPVLPAANKVRENATLLPKILPSRATSGDDFAAVRPSVAYNEDGINLYENLANYSKLECWARKISSEKAVLIVKFISQPSLKDLFCTCLEPKTKQVQDADLDILAVFK